MTDITAVRAPKGWLQRLVGGPAGLGWGLLCMFLFQGGNAIESAWISNFWVQGGMTLAEAGTALTVFGFIGAIASFLAGSLYELMGPKLEMVVGFACWLLADLAFILIATPSGSLGLTILTYGLRGLGTPLVVYGFYTWALYRTEPARTNSVSGAFAFMLTLGGAVVGTALSSALLESLGGVTLLWIGLGFVVAAAVVGIALVDARHERRANFSMRSVGHELGAAVTIAFRIPQIGLGSLVKLIQACFAGFAVYYVTYLTTEIGISQSQAVLVFTIQGLAVLFGNLVWGWLGNVIGWRRTVQWFASLCSGFGLLALYYVPQWAGANFLALVPAALAVGIGLSACIPVNALVVAFTDKEKGAAVAILHLCLGAGSIVGPAIVAATIGSLGYAGVTWVLAALYFSIMVIMHFVRLPGDAKVATAPATPAERPADQQASVTA